MNQTLWDAARVIESLWTIVVTDDQDRLTAIPPIDDPPGVEGDAMMVFVSALDAILAAAHQAEMYGLDDARPMRLGEYLRSGLSGSRRGLDG